MMIQTEKVIIFIISQIGLLYLMFYYFLDTNKTPTKTTTFQSWNWVEDQQPIECEEWLAFLQKSMQEIMNGELGSLCQPNLTTIIIAPLRNANSSCQVMEYVACLLSLPFVVPDVSEQTLTKIINVIKKYLFSYSFIIVIFILGISKC